MDRVDGQAATRGLPVTLARTVGIAIDIAKNAALALGPLRRRQSRKALEHGYDASKDEACYVRGVFEKHSTLITQRRHTLGDVLEIGPGGNIGVALLFLAAGARSATCIDEFPWAKTDLPLHHELVPDPDRLLQQVDYRLEAIETTNLAAGSFDVIYSHACLEHVTDPAATVRQIARLLRPGGVTSHQIDLRDHRDFADPLEFLRYPGWAWRAAQSRRGWTNRWRRSDWEAAFRKEGLVVFHAESTSTVPVGEDDRERLDRRFRGRQIEDLSAIGLLIAATKP